MSVKFTDNSGQVKAEMQAAALRGLEKCGLTAEGYAKKLCPVDTGRMRNSRSRPVRGGTKIKTVSGSMKQFQSTHPVRGGTPPSAFGQSLSIYFNPPTP